ncbi:MAG: TrkA family potassium uptake protein [Acidimicrobiia bacterium]|nr:TrkA family potassium uptake protein [Acidimicrobiia bacterium]
MAIRRPTSYFRHRHVYRWKRAPQRDPWQRVQLSLVLVAAVVALGTAGYTILGLGPFDALYQTVVTVTTVGFAEIGAEQTALGQYRAFTLGLVILGTGAVLYTLVLLVDTLIEGSLNDELRRRRMLRDIEDMQEHVIIAGWGRMGHAIAHSVSRAGQEIVVVDRDPADDVSNHAVVVGEATEDDVLRAAGIDRANTLIAALSNDADNLFLTLSARRMRPDLFIVARTSNQKNEPKFFQAGADRVVDPHEIGGSRMAALALQPNVAEFLDEILHDESHDVEVLEFRIPESSPAVGRTLAELAPADRDSPMVIAIAKTRGLYHANPPLETEVEPGEVIIALGSSHQLDGLRALIG